MTTTYGSSNGTPPVRPNANLDRVAFDNMLRRELKVSDPNDAGQIAQALMQRYKNDPRAAAISQEARGLPFLQTPSSAPAVSLAPVASDAEWKQAIDDTERDLRELTTSALLKDVNPELVGWTQSIRAALQEADNSARFGLDPRQRDKTFGLRRQFGEYARLARLVGTLTPEASDFFRQLGQSLDEVAAVILVRLGEALANAGFSGRFLLQAPYSEIQTRRDAVVYSLRNLVGATQEAYGPNDWPRGLDAYRRLYDALEQQGQGDLRALLVETELCRTMDELMQRVGSGTPDGLRAVAATATVELLRFRRLVATGTDLVRPESPPLTAFLEALQLFADSFSTSGGYRLLRIARPPILLYGLYGTQNSESDTRLLTLTMVRGQLADLADCLGECSCGSGAATLQAIVDLSIYATDRAIDLYALGKTDFGQAECRASAYAYLLFAIAEEVVRRRGNVPDPTLDKLVRTMNSIVLALAPFLPANMPGFDRGLGPVLSPSWRTTEQVFIDGVADGTPAVDIRGQELCLQRNLEARWSEVTESLSVSCADNDAVLGDSGILFALITRALVLNGSKVSSASGAAAVPTNTPFDCSPQTISIPPDLETLLDGFVNDVASNGKGRRI